MARAGTSGPVGPVLAGPIFEEKVGVFIQPEVWVCDWLHVDVAAQ